MECLDELSLGVRGQNMGYDMDSLPVASLTAADHTVPSSDILWALFDMPQETLIHLSPAVRQE